MITGSYYGFLLNAGHVCVADITTSFQFSYASTTGTLQYKREAMWGQDGFVSEHLCTKGIALGLPGMWIKGTIPNFASKHE